MKYKKLGNTEFNISRIGLGMWSMGGDGWNYSTGPQDDKESAKTIICAIEQGINWVDTAPVYGLGHSESLLGKVLKDIPENNRPYIFTKCGETVVEGMPQRSGGTRRDVKLQVESSLERLGVDRLDLCQMHHVPSDGSQIEEYWQALIELKQEGKIGAIGLSNHSYILLKRAQLLHTVESLQIVFNPIKRDFAGRDLSFCIKNNTGVITYSPLHSGILTGKYNENTKFADSDIRKTFEDFRAPKINDYLYLVSKFAEIAKARNTTVSTVVLAWCLSWEGVTGVIAGARTPNQVLDWISAPELELTISECAEIENAISSREIGSGPSNPFGERIKIIASERTNIHPEELPTQTYKFSDLDLILPADHMLPSYLSTHSLLDKFLPFLVQYIGNNNTVIDIGANCGDTLVSMVEKNPRLQYISIEPDDLFFEYLVANSTNIKKTYPRTSITLVKSLISNTYVTGSLIGDNTNKFPRYEVGNADAKHTLKIDQLLAGHETQISLLKCDVEGYDWDVISSGYNTINTHKPILFFEALTQDSEKLQRYIQLLQELNEMDYTYWAVFDNFGAPIFRCSNVDSIVDFLRYVYAQNVGLVTRTIYYCDILVCTSNQAKSVKHILDLYNNSFVLK